MSGRYRPLIMGLTRENNPRKRYQRHRLYLLAAAAILIFGFCSGLMIRRLVARDSRADSVYSTLNLKTLGQFVFDDQVGVDSDIPAQFRALDGKRVKLEGFIVSGPAGQVFPYQLVWRLGDSYGPPQVQDRVFLHIPASLSGFDVPSFVTVMGTLHVKVTKGSEGDVTSVYDMIVDEVTPESEPLRVK